MSLSRSQQRTYHALVSAGLEILLEKGYDALNVSEITERADYGRSTFYLYFTDKEDFIWSILRDQAEQLDAYILAEVADLDYPQREFRAWEIIFLQIEQQASFWQMLDGKTSQQLRQRQRVLLIDLFERNLSAGNFQLPIQLPPDLGARYLVGTASEILEYWVNNLHIGTAQEMAKLLCDLVYK